MLIEKAVCMHEEDAGLLWKHVEYRTNHSEVRRSRRLVLSFVATVISPSDLLTLHALTKRSHKHSQQFHRTAEMCKHLLWLRELL